MIVFYSDDNAFDFSHLKIKFVEENSIFSNNLFSKYTLPFQIPPDSEILASLGNLGINNISDYSVKLEGKLFVDTQFYESYLILESKKTMIEGTLFYGQETLSFLENKLSEFPFPTITTEVLTNHAKDVITKGYPEVGYNFPMVFDDNQKESSGYSSFEGTVNKYVASDFVTNTTDGPTGDALNKNIMVPFPYILEILKHCFASAGFDITGTFVNDPRSRFLLLDVKKHLEYLESLNEESYNLINSTSQTIVNDVTINEYKKTHNISTIGTYHLQISMSLPFDFEVESFEVYEDSKLIFFTNSNSFSKELIFNKTDDSFLTDIDVVLKIKEVNVNIESYNNFRFFLKESNKVNTFKDDFSLNEVLPDISFGDFLLKLKNWLNLKIDISSNFVSLDYVEQHVSSLDFIDFSEYEIKHPKIDFNQNNVFEISEAEEKLIINAQGLNQNRSKGVRNEDLIPLELPAKTYKVENREGVTTQLRDSDSEFGILIYTGLDANSKPTCTNNIDGFNYSLQSVYNEFWKKWLHFRTNSEEYKETYTANVFHSINIDKGVYKYNKKFLVKKITKTRISKDNYSVETEMLSY